MSNESNCILSNKCKLAGSVECTRQCGLFVGLHGQDSLGGRIGSANIPRDYRNVTIETSPVGPSQATIYADMLNYAGTFERQFDQSASLGNPLKSVYLYSKEPGTGKTTTAVALLHEWIKTHYIGSLKRKQTPLQTPGFFLDVTAWQQLYNQFNRPKVPDRIAEPASAKYYAQMEKARTAPFAVLDDIGVRNVTEGFRGDLHTVVNYRVTNNLPTVYTSNLPIKYEGQKELALKPYDLEDLLDERRLVDRIRDRCMVETFRGESKRGKRR